MDGKDATPHGSSPIGLERFETDHQIVQSSREHPTTSYARSHGTERRGRLKRPEKRRMKV